MDTMSNDKPLPKDISDYPPAAYGAGAPVESYAKYTKLRSGAFGLRVPGGAKPDMLVTVRTNAGQIRQERVGIVLWTGNDRYTGEPMALCTIVGAPRPQAQPQRSQPAPQPQPAPTAPNKRQRIPVQPQPAKPKRPGRQRLPRIAAEDEREATAGESAAQERVARIDDERAEAETKLGLDEPLF